jgi:hypothetical protein
MITVLLWLKEMKKFMRKGAKLPYSQAQEKQFLFFANAPPHILIIP